MGSRNYQYGTSPRKYEPEYDDRPRRKKAKSKNTKNSRKNKRQERLEALILKFWLIVNAAMILLALLIVGSRTALINQRFAEIQNMKSQISEMQKENDQLEISIQNSLNLSNIEQTAKEMLGMQKLSSKQTVYLSLPKKDYVEPSTEEIIIEEKSSIFKSIIEYIFNMF